MTLIQKTITAAAVLFSATSYAHVVVISEPHFAESYSEFTLVVPHGCKGVNLAGSEQSFDTKRVAVSIDNAYELAGLRPLNSLFGRAEITESTDETTITWTNNSELYATDSHAYNLKFRAKTPAAPFTKLYFPAVQTCEDDAGAELVVEWVGEGGHGDHAMSDMKPAPSVFLYPKRMPGWNLYTVDEHVHDLSVFSDAEIVWTKDKSLAWSANPETLKMIEEDESVGVLEEIHPGFEIWVKY